MAVHRADRPLWTFQVGTSGRSRRRSDAATRFRMGSVTKTFTAVLVMQCRDDGLLDLDDPVSAHLPVPAHGELTIRRLLSHTSGLQREPYGDVWDTLRTPDAEQVLADLARAERVLPTARRYHYSNLGLSLLGHLVGRLRGGTWAEVLADRILDAARTDRHRHATRASRRRSATWSTRTPTTPGRSRRPTSAASRRPPSSGRPRPTWPAGRRSWPIRPQWTPAAPCWRRPQWRRCAGRCTVDRRRRGRPASGSG